MGESGTCGEVAMTKMKCEICDEQIKERTHVVGICHARQKSNRSPKIEIRFTAYPPLKKTDAGEFDPVDVCHDCQVGIMFGWVGNRSLGAAVDRQNGE